MASNTVPPGSAASELAGLLDSPEVGRLIGELEATRWTGRPGYPIRAMVGMALAKSMYAIPTWTRTVALVREHAALRSALGCADESEAPSVYACYCFAAKLRRHKAPLDACIGRVTASLRVKMPEYGRDVAIDASDLPAYANGQRYVSKGGRERERFSDPDASWVTARRYRPAKAEASTATRCRRRSARARTSRWPGASRRRARTSRTSRCR